jgi:hypothetical protein
MSKLEKAVIIISSIIVLGLIIGSLIPVNFGCTKKMCNPILGEGIEEIPCNSCGGEGNYIFYLGIFNVLKYCPGTQIMIFENGILIDERIDISSCKYKITSLF